MHPVVPTPPRRLPCAFPSALAAAERNRQHVQAGRRQRPPPWHGTSAPGLDNSARGAGTREEPALCFPSDAGTPRLLSLPCSVHCTGDQILSLLASRDLFLPPSKKIHKQPISGPPGTLTKNIVQRQSAALEKPNPASDLSPLAAGTPSCCQRCRRRLRQHSPANHVESPSLSALTENPAFFFPVFPEFLVGGFKYVLNPSKQQSCSVQPCSSAGTVLNTTNQPCFQPFLPRTPHPLAPAPCP